MRVGTASWTDPEFIKAGWYPPEVKDDAEGRLRYYADRFAMVEVNSTFYALPRTGLVESWAARTRPAAMSPATVRCVGLTGVDVNALAKTFAAGRRYQRASG